VLWINVGVRSVMDISGFAEQHLAQFEAEMVFHWNMPGWAAMKSAEKHLGMAALNLPASFAIRAP
jgi:hypothetical protein